jgi:hypothetical protein
MKNSALFLLTLLTIGPATIASAEAGERTIAGTGTAVEIARQYADGGPYGGATSGHTGTTLDVARDSLKFLGAPDRLAADWRMPPVVAKGD